MTFDEFLDDRLADLVRFAVVLCGQRSTGEQLVADAVGHVYEQRVAIEDADAAFTALRVWIVRGYLSEGMRLGAGPATDVDSPIVDASQAGDDWDDLTARFVTSSKLQRTLAALRYFAGLDVAEIASVMGSTLEGIASYLDRVLHDLNVHADDGRGVADSPEANSEDDVRILLDLYGDDVDPDVDSLAGSLRDLLPDGEAEAEPLEEEPVEAEPVEAEPVEAEPVEAEPVEAAPVEAEPIAAKPIAAKRVKPEPAAQVTDGKRTRKILAIVLAGLLAVIVVLGIVYGVHLHSQNDDLRASVRKNAASKALRSEVQKTATTYAVEFGSYDYRHLDADFAKVTTHLTKDFAKTYAQNSASLKSTIVQYQGRSTAKVQGVAASGVSTKSATVLLFLDQSVTTSQSTTPRLDRNRLQMTLTRVGGKWLISKLLLL